MTTLFARALRRLTVTASALFFVLFAFGVAAPASAGVPGDNAVLLDPFDPVPQIGFHHDCDDECGRCERGCYHRRHYRRCEHDCCGERCEEEYWAYIWSLRRYERETDTYNMLLHVYTDELHDYDRRYLDGHGHFDDRGFQEFRHAMHWDEPHYGDADHHYGDGDHRDGEWHDGDRHDHDGDHRDHDWHDGDHHDGDWHDRDHHDGDHRDGDHHDGDWHGDGHHDGDGYHDGDHHDGDHHDGDHHDGWRDGDGNWHDGPPPGDYPH